MKQPVSLIALDMDGTLFNGQSEISKEDQDAIREASSRGIHVAISTGRPYAGLPVTLLSGLGVSYAITSNGAAVYHLPDRLCIHESAMEPALVCPIIEELQKKSIHMDAFINGDGFSQRSCEGKIDCLDMPTSIKRYIHRTRTFTDDLAAYIRVHNLNVQKMTLNFYPQEDGTFLYRDEVMQILSLRRLPQSGIHQSGRHQRKRSHPALFAPRRRYRRDACLRRHPERHRHFKNRSDRRRHGKCPAGSEGDRRLCDALQ